MSHRPPIRRTGVVSCGQKGDLRATAWVLTIGSGIFSLAWLVLLRLHSPLAKNARSSPVYRKFPVAPRCFASKISVTKRWWIFRAQASFSKKEVGGTYNRATGEMIGQDFESVFAGDDIRFHWRDFPDEIYRRDIPTVGLLEVATTRIPIVISGQSTVYTAHLCAVSDARKSLDVGYAYHLTIEIGAGNTKSSTKTYDLAVRHGGQMLFGPTGEGALRAPPLS